MGSRSLVALGLVAAAAVLAGWWLLRDGDAPIAPTDLAGSREPTSSVTPQPRLAAGGTGGPAGPSTAPPPTPPTFTGTAFLHGRVTRAGVPEGGVLVEARGYAEVPVGEDEPEGVRAFYRGVLRPPGVLPVLASARSGADGTFKLEGIAEKTFAVEARAEDGTGARALVRASSKPADATTLELAPGSPLEVRCVWDDGTPMAGTVALRGKNDPSSESVFAGAVGPLEVTGTRRFADVKPGAFRLTLYEGGGSVFLWTPLVVPHVGVLELRAPRTVPLRGRVVGAGDGERGVAGAFVVSMSPFPGGRRTELADAGGDGTFTLGACPGSAVRWTAGAAGFLEASVTTTPPTDAPVRIELGVACRVSGRLVRAGDGTALAGVTIHASPEGNAPPATSTTDAAGHFAFAHLPAAPVLLWSESHPLALAGSSAPSSAPAPTVTPVPGKETTVDLRAVEGGTIEGIVVDEAGSPLAGARVYAKPEERPSDDRRTERRTAATTSGPDGRFAFLDLRRDRAHHLQAADALHPRGRAGPVVASTVPGSSVEIRLSAGRFIDVLVRDGASGAGVAGASVEEVAGTSLEEILDEEPLEGEAGAAARITDGTGRLRIGPLPARSVQITIRANGYLRAHRTLPTGSAEAVEIPLARGLRLTGRVTRPDGSPAIGAQVYLRGDSLASDVTRMSGFLSTDTDASGAFALENLPPGVIPVEATFTPSRVTAGVALSEETGIADPESGTSDCVIRLTTNASSPRVPVAVHVVDADGSPVPSASLCVDSARWSTNAEVVKGLCVFVPSGFLMGADDDRTAALLVTVHSARDAAGKPLALGAARAELAPGETSITVRLERSAAIRGIVRGPDGAPRGDVVVRLELEHRREERLPTTLASTTTGADGTFELVGAGRDPCRVTLTAPHGLLAPKPVEVRAGATGIELCLRAAASATITVLGPGGTPQAGATVQLEPKVVYAAELLDGDWPWRPVTTDAAGRTTFGRLDDTRRYALEVNASGGSTLAFRAEDWSPADTTVRLRRAFRVTGVVRDPQGHSLSGMRVAAFVGWELSSTGTDGAGRFVLEGLVEGPVKLRARPPSEESEDECPHPGTMHPPEWNTVPADSTDVVLIVDLGATLGVQVEGWFPHEAGIAMGVLRSPPTAVLVPDGASDPDGRRSSAIADDGTARFYRLDPAVTYTLWVGPAGSRSLRKPGVGAGADLHVRLEPTKTLALRVLGPSPLKNVSFLVEDCPLAQPYWRSVQVRGDGTVDFPGFPPGTYTIRARMSAGAQKLEGKVAVEAGGPRVDLRVEPDPEGKR